MAAKAFLRDKALGGVDQFLQVFHPVSAFFLDAVVLQQTALVQHQVDDLAQRQALGLLTDHIDHGDKRPQIRPGLAGGGAHRIVQ